MLALVDGGHTFIYTVFYKWPVLIAATSLVGIKPSVGMGFQKVPGLELGLSQRSSTSLETLEDSGDCRCFTSHF